MLSCLTEGPVCLRDALDSDPLSSQPVPGEVLAGLRDKEEMGGIGGVKYRLVYWGPTWFGAVNMYQRDAAVTGGILLHFVAFNLQCTNSTWQELQTRKHKSL